MWWRILMCFSVFLNVLAGTRNPFLAIAAFCLSVLVADVAMAIKSKG